jgi:prepilin-type N-terminal cleavage/methylation domain-containing protein
MRYFQKRQAGVTLLEMMIALGILAAVSMGVGQITQMYANNQKIATAAQQIASVGQASQAYINDNLSAVLAVATATTPAVIPASALRNYAAGIQSTNALGQTMCTLVLQPSAGQLTAIVVTAGGTTVDDSSLGTLAGIIGAAGGAIYSTAGTTLKGTAAGWSLAVGNFANANKACSDGVTAGAIALAVGHPIMALWFTNNAYPTAVLYRSAVPGNPQLNAMSTPLVLSASVTTGGACSTSAAVAADTNGNGKVLSCQGGTWQAQSSAYWGDPVTTYAALPTCNASIAWQTRVVQTPTVGTGPRGYTCDGAAWQPLTVNDNGNLTVAGTLTANGTTNLNGSVNLNVTATEGGFCTGNGVAQNGGGLLLSCQSGVWHPVTDINGYWFYITGYSSPQFQGIGRYHSTTGTFSGYIWTTPNLPVISTWSGNIWCGDGSAGADCAVGIGIQYGPNIRIYVSNIRISLVGSGGYAW